MPSLRRSLALALLLAWIVVLGFHVRREYFPASGARLAAGARLLAPGTHFYLVRLQEQVIGFAQASLDTVPGGFRVSDLLQLRVPAPGKVHDTSVRTLMLLDAALGLRRFEFQLASDAGTFGVSGEARDSLLELTVAAGGGERQRSRIRITPDLLLGAALPMRLAAAGVLQVGQQHSVRVFDPATLGSRLVTARITGRDTLIVSDSAREVTAGKWAVSVWDTVPVWRVEQSYGGVKVISYVDEDGQMVREESPLGYVIERTVYELAREAWDAARRSGAAAAGYGDIIEGTAIASNVDLSSVSERSQLMVRLRGVELEGFDLEGGRQRLRGDTLTITRESVGPAGFRLPFRGGGEAAGELGSDPLIQSADPGIVAAARRATDGTSDPVQAARRLNGWVHRRLEKEIALTVPSAVQVLERRRGDCNEHTVLYVALARSLGLPARTAVGVVHVNGSFYYHAWPEVWLGEWVAVDPTLGQFPADASHLRFLHGGLARQVELVRLIGRLRLEVQ